MTEYGYVVVHETKDAAQGEVLAELLRQRGDRGAVPRARHDAGRRWPGTWSRWPSRCRSSRRRAPAQFLRDLRDLEDTAAVGRIDSDET